MGVGQGVSVTDGIRRLTGVKVQRMVIHSGWNYVRAKMQQVMVTAMQRVPVALV